MHDVLRCPAIAENTEFKVFDCSAAEGWCVYGDEGEKILASFALLPKWPKQLGLGLVGGGHAFVGRDDSVDTESGG